MAEGRINKVKIRTTDIRRILLVILLVFLCCSTSACAIKYTWLELGKDGKQIARLITREQFCPWVTTNLEDPIRQDVRWTEEDRNFRITICETTLPDNVTKAEVGWWYSYSLLKEKIDRIAIIGDTGCRIKGKYAQDCNNPDKWPLRKIAELVAEAKPDLIIHVGDYYYRENKCPENADCQGSPYGDNWKTWRADFFEPMEPALNIAPWIMVRGNHESCDRGWEGWFNLIDPGDRPGTCTDFSDPYTIKAGDLKFVVIDSSNANDAEADENYTKQLTPFLSTLIKDNETSGYWLLSHKPIWGIAKDYKIPASQGAKADVLINTTLQSTFSTPEGERFLAAMDMILSGHMHIFEMLDVASSSGPQYIVGNSGTSLDGKPAGNMLEHKFGDKLVENAAAFDDFGFAMLTREGDGWLLTLIDKDGREISKCSTNKKSTSCM